MSETSSVSTEAGRPTIDIWRDLSAAIASQGLEFGRYDFGHVVDIDEVKTWPRSYLRVACYPVVDKIEGYYVHIDLMIGRYRRHVTWAHTWTWESAWAIAKAATELLDPKNQ